MESFSIVKSHATNLTVDVVWDRCDSEIDQIAEDTNEGNSMAKEHLMHNRLGTKTN